LHDILNDMHNKTFSNSNDFATTQDMRNFKIFEASIIESYEIFYDEAGLQEIWKRVCTKAYEAITRFLNETTNGMAQLSEREEAPDPRHRLPIERKYKPDNAYTFDSSESMPLHSFLMILPWLIMTATV